MSPIKKTLLQLQEHKPIVASPLKADQYSPLVLAYMGDAVFEMVVRTVLVNQGNIPVNKLHGQAKAYVRASAQKAMFHKIEDLLTETEIKMYKRGRNAKSSTKAKNASVSDYRIATGLEALIGYLYLDNQMERVMELMAFGMKDA